MPRNKSTKKIPDFDFSFNDISFCNDSKLKPFIETFVQEPENIAQQNLGTIFGIFEITDNSEDSSYITNYLISVIKKEYFSRPKRGAIESFEAALHKANLALSRLAEHGNVAWIGKINIICAAVEKYNLHLTQIGSCHAFLLREKNLTNISENISSTEDRSTNPLKTFTDVSSGKIEENDKIIISTNNILDIFSFDEIKKSANKFSKTDFVRFLHTALVNELSKAAVLIIDIKKKEEKKPKTSPNSYQESFNAFSSMSFEKTIPKEPLAENLKDEIREELEKSNKEIGNIKSGHIYIKEIENLPEEKKTFFSFSLSSLGNNIFRSLDFSKEKIKNIFSILFLKLKSIELKPAIFAIKGFLLKIASAAVEIIGSLALKTRKIFEKIKKHSALLYKERTLEEKTFENKTELPQKTHFSLKIRSSLLPNFSKIKSIFSKFSYEQKVYAVIILLLIFVVPYVGVKIEKKMAEKRDARIAQNAPKEITPLEQDINVVRLSDLNTIHQNTNSVSRIINLNGKMFFVGNSEIFDLGKNRSFPFPSEIRNIRDSVSMNDLNLIILITEDKKTFSFSPSSEKFQSNLIEIPIDANISASETYLTYLYLVDSKANQIYRYPRAEGGFGAKVNWLRDTTDLSKVSDISVNENIFAVSPNEITKLFKGKRQDFSTEETATPIVFDKIYIAKNNQEIYILDKINSRIVQLNPEGNILNQYYNEKIREASSFSADENGTIYFAVGDAIYTFGINQ